VRGDDGVRAAADALEAVSQPEQTGRGRPGGRSGA
jgi:hypothetical protein